MASPLPRAAPQRRGPTYGVDDPSQRARLEKRYPLGALLADDGCRKQAFAVRGRKDLVALVQRDFLREDDGRIVDRRPANHPERVDELSCEHEYLETARSWGLPALNVLAFGSYPMPTLAGGQERRSALVVERFDVASKELVKKDPAYLARHLPRLIDAEGLKTLDRLEALLDDGKLLIDCQVLLREHGEPKMVVADVIAKDLRKGEVPEKLARMYSEVQRKLIADLRGLAQRYADRGAHASERSTFEAHQETERP